MRVSLKNILQSFLDKTNDNNLYTEEHFNVLVQGLRKINFIQSFDDFGKKLQKSSKIWGFLKMFEDVLLFQRATRQSLWDLHLESLEKFEVFYGFRLNKLHQIKSCLHFSDMSSKRKRSKNVAVSTKRQFFGIQNWYPIFTHWR